MNEDGYRILDLIIALNKVLQERGNLPVMAEHFETEQRFEIMSFPTFQDEPEMAIHVYVENDVCLLGINDAHFNALAWDSTCANCGEHMTHTNNDYGLCAKCRTEQGF